MLTDDEKLAVAVDYAAATRSGDLDALALVCEPDAVVWHNHDDRVVDLGQSNRMLGWLHGNVDGLDWVDVAVTPTAEGFVWRAILVGMAQGGPLRAHTCMVVTLSSAGRVARMDEYLDSAAVAVLTGS